MKRSLRSITIGVCIVCLCAALLFLQQSASVQTVSASAPAETVLKADANLKWRRGNIHTHSMWSDGDDYLEMIGLWYRDHGYDFLCYTDHNILSNSERWVDAHKSEDFKKAYNKLKAKFPDWVEERTKNGKTEVRLRRFDEVNAKIGIPGKFLLMLGEEISDRANNLPVHLNVTNIRDLIPPMRGETVYDAIQNNVNAAIAQRERTGQAMLVHLNHPNFVWAVTAEDIMRLRGEKFFEVYNGHHLVNNSGDEVRASTERIWDIVLTKRLGELGLPVMYGLGTDDGHDYHNMPSRNSEPGRGWVMVLAKDLTPESIIEAMEGGNFYASSGVSLENVSCSLKGLEVTVKPDEGANYSIEFVGTRRGYNPKGEPVRDKEGKEVRTTLRYSNEIGTVLKKVAGVSGSYEFTGDEIYVRARIVSTRKHPNPSEVGEFERAWTQPAIGPAAMNTDL